MSTSKVSELIATHLMERPEEWWCDRCLSVVLRALGVPAAEATDSIVRDVADQLRAEPGFECTPERCGACSRAALVSLRYVPNREAR
jgi:hypothetical protein